MRVNAAHWIALTTLGLVGGLAAGAAIGAPLGRLVHVDVVVAVFTLITGAILGTLQAAALRPLLPKPSRWIAATIAGATIGLVLGVVTVQQIATLATGAPLHIAQLDSATRAISFLATGGIAGTVLGAAQWLVLRSRVRHWILACGAALAIAFCLASLLVDAAGVRYATAFGRFAFLLLSGLTFGALTSRPLQSVR